MSGRTYRLITDFSGHAAIALLSVTDFSSTRGHSPLSVILYYLPLSGDTLPVLEKSVTHAAKFAVIYRNRPLSFAP